MLLKTNMFALYHMSAKSHTKTNKQTPEIASEILWDRYLQLKHLHEKFMTCKILQ
jgi:hypothetical protein